MSSGGLGVKRHLLSPVYETYVQKVALQTIPPMRIRQARADLWLSTEKTKTAIENPHCPRSGATGPGKEYVEYKAPAQIRCDGLQPRGASNLENMEEEPFCLPSSPHL